MKSLKGLCAAALAACLWLPAGALQAQGAAEERKAFEDARRAALEGPADVPVAGQGKLKVPAGHVFIPQPQAGRLLKAMGNPGTDDKLHGLVFPGGDAGWFATLRYLDAGHIPDDDARDWNADDLLRSLKEGTEASNEERQKMGVAALEVLGWAERPAYDAATHRLVWAVSAREKGAGAEAPQGVNYNTLVLGREGYFSLNLVTDMKSLAAHKPMAQSLLASLSFDEGRRYADFNSSTDRTAEYGLAALVAGVAAKKLGLLALAATFFAKFAKVILVGLALVGGAATKLFRRKKAP